MIAERLREAAARIRETAQAATPGPWTVDEPRPRYITTAAPIDVDEADWGTEEHTAYRLGTNADERAWRYADVRHIALWSPPVALAVADWLDSASDMTPESGRALAVADLILGGAR